MMNILYLILFLFYTHVSFGQTNMNGIVYKPTSETVNYRATELILNEIKKPTGILFKKSMYCGPKLWDKIKDNIPFKNFKSGNVQINIPNFNSKGEEVSHTKSFAKLIQEKADFVCLWSYILTEIKKGNFHIRKLTPHEIKYYWSIIFFDIEEPIFILDNGRIKVLINLSKDMEIIWLDLL